MMDTQGSTECHCIIRHPQTDEEREAIKRHLEYSRKTGDTVGIILSIAQLTGACQTNKDTKQ
jgi:hypothetical protein